VAHDVVVARESDGEGCSTAVRLRMGEGQPPVLTGRTTSACALEQQGPAINSGCAAPLPQSPTASIPRCTMAGSGGRTTASSLPS
jgi:hypothetical protein